MEYVKLFTRIPKSLKKEFVHYCINKEEKQHKVVVQALKQFLEAEKQAK